MTTFHFTLDYESVGVSINAKTATEAMATLQQEIDNGQHNECPRICHVEPEGNDAEEVYR